MTEKNKNTIHKKDRLVIYTALFGDYDDLVDPNEKFDGCDFVCFTDQKHLKSDIWDIRLVEDCGFPPNIMNRKYKFLPHLFLSNSKYSLYIDSNLLIHLNPVPLVSCLSSNNIVLPGHKQRTCVYDEIIACYAADKAGADVLYCHYKFLISQNYPKNNGLTENNIILRRHNSEESITWGDCVWNSLNKYVQRDQLLVQYCAWKNNISISELQENAWDKGSIFSFRVHKKYQAISFYKRVSLKLRYLIRFLLFFKNIKNYRG